MRCGPVRLALVAAVGVCLLAPVAQAGSRGHRGSGYGLAGGLSPDLALGNVYSGIYGLGFTYDRAHVDFNGCPVREVPRAPGVLTVRRCRPPVVLE